MKVETNGNWGARVQDYHVISTKPDKTSREHTLLRTLIKTEFCLLTSALPDYFQNLSAMENFVSILKRNKKKCIKCGRCFNER